MNSVASCSGEEASRFLNLPMPGDLTFFVVYGSELT